MRFQRSLALSLLVPLLLYGCHPQQAGAARDQAPTAHDVGAVPDSKDQVAGGRHDAQSGDEKNARDGDGLAVDRDVQARLGLKCVALARRLVQPKLVAYGHLEADPAATFTLRAPIAGTLQARDHAWPDLGAQLAAGTRLGTITPRILPVDRTNLQAQLASAIADFEADKAALEASSLALQRARILNGEAKNVSDQDLQAAEARVGADRARLAAAQKTVAVIRGTLAGDAGVGGAPTLALARGGQVGAILAQPGENVDVGQPILRVTNFQTLIARIDVPAGEAAAQPHAPVALAVLGQERHPLSATPLGLAEAADATSQGEAFLFRVRDAGMPLRPGMAVTAELPAIGAAERAFVIPTSAVVYSGNQAEAYVRDGDRFVARDVDTDHPVPGGYLVRDGFDDGDQLVVRGAQMLLTQQLQSATSGGSHGDGDD